MAGFDIEVVFALPGQSWRRLVRLSEGATAGEAVIASGLDAVCRHQTGQLPQRIGIHGRKVTPDTRVQPGQRIELYRPLEIDPKAQRAARAGRQRQSPS